MSDSIPSNSAPEFSLAVRGYDRLQVETYVDRLRDQLEECTLRLRRTEERAAATARERNARITELEQRIAELEQRRLDTTASSFSGLGERIGQMLELAAQEGNAMKERAAREAEDILDRARRSAQDIEQRRSSDHERLQRQLHSLHDTVMGLLDSSSTADVERAAPAGGSRIAAVADEVTQAMDAVAVQDAMDSSRRAG